VGRSIDVGPSRSASANGVACSRERNLDRTVTMTGVAEKRARFRDLHRDGCFVLPNPWDVGGARRLEAMGFAALATTSAGLAWSLGKRDYECTVDEVLGHLSMMVGATDLPLNADFEGGFASDTDELARNVAAVVATGVAGFSLEDRAGSGLLSRSEAVEGIRTARRVVDEHDPAVVLVARCEGRLLGCAELPEVISRLATYAEAGADCVYAPGLKTLSDIGAVVRAVAPTPVNVLVTGPGLRVADLADLGVRRVSVGGALAGAAWAAFDRAAKALAERGEMPPREQ
jgi:2-methylisocitrate lyase-like PEP mutase family enzyme